MKQAKADEIIAKIQSGTELAETLGELLELFEVEENLNYFHNSQELFEAICQVFLDYQARISTHEFILGLVLECISNFLLNKQNTILLCHSETPLLPIFVQAMKANPSLQESIEIILSSCVYHEENHSVLFHPSLGYLRFLRSRIAYYFSPQASLQELNEDEINPIELLVEIFQEIKQEQSLQYFIDLQFPELFISQFFKYSTNTTVPASSSSKDYEEDEWERCQWNHVVLSFFISFSSFSLGCDALKNRLTNENVLFLFQLLNKRTMDGSKVAILLANLYGRRNDGGQDLSEELSAERIISLLSSLFDLQCNYYENREVVKDFIIEENYQMGEISLKEIVFAIRNLSYHKELKNLLLNHPRLFEIIGQTLERYLQNKPLVFGMEEYDSPETNQTEENHQKKVLQQKRNYHEEFQVLEMILELLNNVYYHYEENKEFQLSFELPSPYSLKEILEDIVDISYHRRTALIDYYTFHLLSNYQDRQRDNKKVYSFLPVKDEVKRLL
jgi:AcrR family transcriptional regulator